MTAPDVERLAEVLASQIAFTRGRGWTPETAAIEPEDRGAARRIAQRIVASDVWVESMAQAWDEGKHSEHIPACRLGDGDCTCPNPYRTDPSDD